MGRMGFREEGIQRRGGGGSESCIWQITVVTHGCKAVEGPFCFFPRFLGSNDVVAGDGQLGGRCGSETPTPARAFWWPVPPPSGSEHACRCPLCTVDAMFETSHARGSAAVVCCNITSCRRRGRIFLRRPARKHDRDASVQFQGPFAFSLSLSLSLALSLVFSRFLSSRALLPLPSRLLALGVDGPGCLLERAPALVSTRVPGRSFSE
ncbi:hypothetical protein V8C35DRAFT_82442 [Trichoderma chlorosporum]